MVDFPLTAKARKCGNGWIDICPAHDDSKPSLSVSVGAHGQLLLHCFAGCEFSDIVSAAGLNNRAWQATPNSEDRKLQILQQELDAANKLARCHQIWRQGQPIEGTLSQIYLMSRGITIWSDSQRHHAGLTYSLSGEKLPVLLTAVQCNGKLVGLHRTFLNQDGTKRDKLMLGRVKGGSAQLFGREGTLFVSEGIETAMSLQMLNPEIGGRQWAALSCSGMKSLILPSQTDQLIIAADGDKPGLEAANALGDRAARLGWDVLLLAAPDGQDWNDVLMEALND